MQIRSIDPDRQRIGQILLGNPDFRLGRPSEQIEFTWDQPIDPKSGLKVKRYLYINNPTGGVRWFFPADNPHPSHLALYNSASLTAKAYKLTTYLAYFFRQAKMLCSGYFEVGIPESEVLGLEEILSQVGFDSYAVFTGTVGENRKTIVALNQGSRTTHFVKIAHSLKSIQLIRREEESLRDLADWNFSAMHAPSVAGATDQALILTNVRPDHGREQARIGEVHVRALREMYQAFGYVDQLSQLPFWSEIHTRIQHLKVCRVHDPAIELVQIRRIVSMLTEVFDSIPAEQHIRVSMTHGDFTPWNMYIDDKGIYVYDWELSKASRPLLYDMFHFSYQSGVMLLRQKWPQIRRELLRDLRLPTTRMMVEQFQLDIHLLHGLYLLDNITYYLNIYLQEPKVHQQVYWLLDVWESSLEAYLRQDTLKP
ncbi:phosphotransferase [Pontibacter sp. G13]|uniref:phosphotransferase n=1 Tax=Pontibacter sp. G13 TaxID=3074898 RepID=UPI00288958F0|nr:phosphotransferase [Pontibacter sp. G13]WNJ19312.1 phosphotransferase [Pontibacter sp. G13]